LHEKHRIMNYPHTFFRFSLCMLMVAGLAACKKEKPVPPAGGGGTPPPNEQELITTVLLVFESLDGTQTSTFSWRDLDGDGGNPPVIETEPLLAGTAYRMHVQVLDESNPDAVEDITEEIAAEDEEHQFFFIVAGAEATFSYGDADANGNPVGLETLWSTGAASAGTLRVVLRHELNKDAPGVSDGDITNAGGDTDVDVTFPLVVQ
jgi:hypothetical protein